GLAILDAFYARNTRMGGSAPLAVADARREIIAASGDDATASADGSDAVGTHTDVRGNSAPVVSRSAANSNRAGNRAASGRPNGLRVLSVDPETYNVLQRARAAREAGRQEDAVKYYRNVLAREGGYFPPANLELAFALVNLKRTDEAIAALAALVAHDGTRYPVAYYHLGRLYEETNQLARAADSYTRAAALYGEANPQVLIDLSRVREKSGDNAGALNALEAYAKALAAEGAQPAWVTEKLAKLRTATNAPATPKP
ncbi:MAG TPA: tetratricopeptide repeat protein, partial [Pyrinomonadaceae bacterium]|nr:tetratricopeptide repeat protein [Pyrinomonadaceae bacterium]